MDPVEDPTQPVDILYQSNLQQISNLCSVLCEVAEGRGCLGLLTTPQCKQFSLSAIRHHARTRTTDNIARLHDLLSDGMSSKPATSSQSSLSSVISGADKRWLAVCLASSALQLYQTPWLGEEWSRHDIFFMREVDGSSKAMIRQPFVSRSFHN